MNLAIFDIDGTLVRTRGINQVTYGQAFREHYGLELSELDWSQVPYSTDSGIVPWVLEQVQGRPALDHEVAHLKALYLEALAEHLQEMSADQMQVNGAAKAFARLGRQAGWALALASGGWQAGASLKLAKAGIEWQGLPAAFAEDSPARSAILRIALERACRQHRVDSFQRVVYLGDAFWDLAAAGRLGLAFVGVGRDKRGQSLRQAGAQWVIPDYQDFQLLLQALQEATVPPKSKAAPD